MNSPYAITFNIEGHLAKTLRESDIGTHTDGWAISGEIHEDYYKWVNAFEAAHPVYGKVWGNFETTVYAESEEGYDHFVQHHPPEDWDYWDI